MHRAAYVTGRASCVTEMATAGKEGLVVGRAAAGSGAYDRFA